MQCCHTWVYSYDITMFPFLTHLYYVFSHSLLKVKLIKYTFLLQKLSSYGGVTFHNSKMSWVKKILLIDLIHWTWSLLVQCTTEFHLFPLWSWLTGSCNSLPLPSILRGHLLLTSLGKDQNLKTEIRFLLNVYLFCTIIKWKKNEVRNHL
jgi:hypothetical protein